MTRSLRNAAASAALILAAALPVSVHAAPQTQTLPDGIEIHSGSTIVRITALRDDVLRVRMGKDALPEDASWAVLPQARASKAAVQVSGDKGGFTLRTKALVAHVDPETLHLTVEDAQGHVLLADAADHALEIHDKGFALRKTLPEGERYFGLGDKTGTFDRRGQAYSMWNTDSFGFQESTDPIYKSIPFTIGVDAEGRSFGLLLDNTFRTGWDFGRVDPTALSITAPDGPLDYYVMAEPSPKAVVEAYAWLTGPAPLPPLWTLGFQQSRYSYMSAQEVKGIASTLRADKVPADAIYMDIDYQDRNRPFTVNTETFPDVPGLARELKGEGIRLVMITDLHIAHVAGQGYAPYDSGAAIDAFVHNPSGSTYVGPVWPGPSVFPDFTRASVRDWWGGLYKGFVADGISGFWNDMNEPAVFTYPSKTMPLDIVHRIDEPGFRTRTATHAEIHNVFGMENSRGTYDGLLKLKPDERPFVLTRASYAGGQRYAATWTGDNSSTWNHLRLQTSQLLNLGLSGFVWAGADVGGFAGSPSPDLLTKWIEVAAFTPIFRDHAAKGTRPHEVWVDGPEHLAIRKRFIEERYRLLPYLYALADQAARTGVPLMRPVVLEYPKASDDGSNFMLGSDLLISPAPEGETLDPWDVQLPTPGWYDYWTGKPAATAMHDGSPGGANYAAVHETPRLDYLPVFVRPGAILPRQPLVQSTSETPKGPLELRIYPGPDCKGSLYLDDGISFGFRKGQFLRQSVHCAQTANGLTVSFDPREGAYAPWWTSVEVVVYGWNAPSAHARLGKAKVEARVDAADGTAHVVIADPAKTSSLVIEH